MDSQSGLYETWDNRSDAGSDQRVGMLRRVNGQRWSRVIVAWSNIALLWPPKVRYLSGRLWDARTVVIPFYLSIRSLDH